MKNILKYLIYIITIHKCHTNKINFISYGNWGESNIYQKLVANTIYNYTKKYNTSFNIVLGNNFYDNGVSSIYDSQWKTKYESIYKNNNPWYVILGNHDYYGNITSQIDYTNQDNRWNMPDKNYVIKEKNLKIIMLDTQQLDPLCSNVSVNVTSYKNKKNIYNWLEKELSTNEAFKIVVGHVGIYSISEYGICNELVNNLFPILESYNIALYLHSHTEILQHNSYKNIDMIGCGTASKVSKYRDLKFSSDYIKYYTLNYGFCFHTIDIDNDNYYIKTQFINENGNILYEYTSYNIPYIDNSTSISVLLFQYLLILLTIMCCLYCCYSLYLEQLKINANEMRYHHNIINTEEFNTLQGKNPLIPHNKL